MLVICSDLLHIMLSFLFLLVFLFLFFFLSLPDAMPEMPAALHPPFHHKLQPWHGGGPCALALVDKYFGIVISEKKRSRKPMLEKTWKILRFRAPPGAPDLIFCWPLQGETRFFENPLLPSLRTSGLEKVMKTSSKSYINRSPERLKNESEKHIEKISENKPKSVTKWALNQHKLT